MKARAPRREKLMVAAAAQPHNATHPVDAHAYWAFSGHLVVLLPASSGMKRDRRVQYWGSQPQARSAPHCQPDPAYRPACLWPQVRSAEPSARPRHHTCIECTARTHLRCEQTQPCSSTSSSWSAAAPGQQAVKTLSTSVNVKSKTTAQLL
jgi:hypothetical protein